MTPVGWARANLAYETLSAPPRPGTLLESIMLLVWRLRQDIELYRTKVLVETQIVASQGSEGGDKILKNAWGLFKDAMFPFQAGVVATQDQKAVEFLKREATRGPIRVTPLVSLTRKRG